MRKFFIILWRPFCGFHHWNPFHIYYLAGQEISDDSVPSHHEVIRSCSTSYVGRVYLSHYPSSFWHRIKVLLRSIQDNREDEVVLVYWDKLPSNE